MIRLHAKVDVSGFEGAQERLRKLQPVMRVMAQRLQASITKQSFGRGRGMNEEVFPPLSPRTVSRKGSSKPLIDTGALRRSVNASATSDGVRFGVAGAPARYGAVHQFGSSSVPRRPFLPVDTQGRPSFVRGPAKKWLEAFRRAVVEFILEGR